jgi:hypothetical protein
MPQLLEFTITILRTDHLVQTLFATEYSEMILWTTRSTLTLPVEWKSGLLGSTVSIGALRVSRGVHNIAFSVSPDVVMYFHLTPLCYYYKRLIVRLQEALSFSWNIFPDYFKFDLSPKKP